MLSECHTSSGFMKSNILTTVAGLCLRDQGNNPDTSHFQSICPVIQPIRFPVLALAISHEGRRLHILQLLTVADEFTLKISKKLQYV